MNWYRRFESDATCISVLNIIKSYGVALNLHKNYSEIAWIISVFFSSEMTIEPCHGNGWHVPSAANKPAIERLATVVQEGKQQFFKKDVDPKLWKF